MRPLIIGIPTYNRPACCETTVKQVLKAVNGLSHVTIMVVDNSDVQNEALVQLSTKENFFGRFEYVKNEKNLGLDGSILELCKRAQQRNGHLWFLCDDDIIFELGIRIFAKAIYEVSSPIKLCQFSFKEGEPTDFTANWKHATEEDYFRASFLPTVCIDTNFYNKGTLESLIGCNYIHIALINEMVNSLSDIYVSDCVVGSQTPNDTLGFSIENTFIRGFIRALSHQQKVSSSEINEITLLRLRGYLSHVIKNIWSRKEPSMNITRVARLTFTIALNLSFAKLLALSPRLIILTILRLIR